MSDSHLRSVIVEVANALAIPGDLLADALTIEYHDDTVGDRVVTELDDVAKLSGLLEDAGIPGESFTDAVAAMQTLATKVSDAHQVLRPLLDSSDPDVGDVADAVITLVDAVKTLGSVEVVSGGPTADEIVVALLEHLVVRHLRTHRPALFQLLAVAGVVDEAAYRARARGQLHVERLADLLLEPGPTITDELGWGTRDFDSDRVVTAVASVLQSWDSTARIIEAPPHDLADNDAAAVRDAGLRALTGPLLWTEQALVHAGLTPLVQTDGDRGLVLHIGGSAVAADWHEVGPDWKLLVAGGLVGAAPLGLVIHPDGVFLALDDGSPVDDGLVGVSLRYVSPERLELLDADWVTLAADEVELQGRVEVVDGEIGGGVGFAATDATLTLAAFGDSFLRSLLADGAEVGLSPVVGWDTDGGFHLGGEGLTVRLPLDLDVAALLVLELLEVRLRPVVDGIELDLLLTGVASLGPVQAALEGFGVGVTARFDAAVDAADAVVADVELIPPRGIGVSVDAGPISGGGFIAYDDDTGRYVGSLALSVDELGIAAFGVLDTRLPGDENGWSLLLFVWASFPAIQLGFGFTLTGVGGIVGIHRGVDVDALFGAVRSGTVGRLLAPEDPVRDAPALAREAGAIFPVQPGQHTLGPTLQLGWGTPSLVQLDIALVVSLPDPLRIVLIGSLHAALPSEDAAVLKLNVDVAGVLDLGASRLDAEGHLYDSAVQLIPVSGGFALRSSWGRSPSLAFSVGGLHPRFTPPPGFPELERLGTDLSRGSLKIRLGGYFAITSNSLQFGAGVDLRFSDAGFLVEGGLEFDALIVFSPFGLDVSLRAWVDVSRRGRHLVSLRLEGRLTGPNRWTVRGSVYVKVLLLEASVSVEASFGRVQPDSLERVTVWPVLEKALADAANWDPAGPSTGALVLAEMAGLIAPDAVPAVTQKRVPLGVRLDHLGGAGIDRARRFSITAAAVNGVERALGAARSELFSPGDFRDMTEAQQLAAPSFEPLDAGVEVDIGAAVEIGAVLTAETDAQVIVIDEPDARPRRQDRAMWTRPELTVRRAAPAGAPEPMIRVEPERWTRPGEPASGRSWTHASEGPAEPILVAEL